MGPLPISDYVTDTSTVLDQAIRILQAMIDITAGNGWLTCTIRIIHLIQMVTQGRWLDDCTLLNLPHINERIARDLVNAGIETLPQMKLAHQKRVEEILRKHDNLNDSKIDTIFKTLYEKIPLVEWRAYFQSTHDVQCGETVTLCIKHRRHGGDPNKIYSPKWYKPKIEGWLIIVANEEADELVALKRIRCQKNWSFVRLEMQAPSEPGPAFYKVYVMSDAYIGLDQEWRLSLRVEQPELDDPLGALMAELPGMTGEEIMADLENPEDWMPGSGFDTDIVQGEPSVPSVASVAQSEGGDDIQRMIDDLLLDLPGAD